MPSLAIEAEASTMATLERMADGAPLNDLCTALLKDGIATAMSELPLSHQPSTPRSRYDFGVRRGRLVCASDDAT